MTDKTVVYGASNDLSQKAMTLRLDGDLHQRIRKAAFNQERPVSALIRDALAKAYPPVNGCDSCGAPTTHVTAAGFRGCDQHFNGTFWA